MAPSPPAAILLGRYVLWWRVLGSSMLAAVIWSENLTDGCTGTCGITGLSILKVLFLRNLSDGLIFCVPYKLLCFVFMMLSPGVMW